MARERGDADFPELRLAFRRHMGDFLEISQVPIHSGDKILRTDASRFLPEGLSEFQCLLPVSPAPARVKAEPAVPREQFVGVLPVIPGHLAEIRQYRLPFFPILGRTVNPPLLPNILECRLSAHRSHPLIIKVSSI